MRNPYHIDRILNGVVHAHSTFLGLMPIVLVDRIVAIPWTVLRAHDTPWATSHAGVWGRTVRPRHELPST